MEKGFCDSLKVLENSLESILSPENWRNQIDMDFIKWVEAVQKEISFLFHNYNNDPALKNELKQSMLNLKDAIFQMYERGTIPAKEGVPRVLLGKAKKVTIETYFIDIQEYLDMFITAIDPYFPSREYFHSKDYQSINIGSAGENHAADNSIFSTVSSVKSLKLINNNLDTVSIDRVWNHFSVLVDRKHLTEEELKTFIIMAFDKMMVPHEKFVLRKLKSKQKIVKVFSDYYSNLTGKLYGKQDVYVALLCDYFEGFLHSSVKSNFAR